MIFTVAIDGKEYRLDLEFADGRWRSRIDGREVGMDAVLVQPDVLSVVVEGRAYEIWRERVGTDWRVWVRGRAYAAEVRDPRSLRGRKQKADHGKGLRHLVAPMPGKVVRFLVEQNSAVEAGQGVVVVESMKMQNEIKSPKRGIVMKWAVTEGSGVNPGVDRAVVE